MVCASFDLVSVDAGSPQVKARCWISAGESESCMNAQARVVIRIKLVGQ